MIAVSIAVELEWKVVLNYYQIEEEACLPYPFGCFFLQSICGEEIMFFLTGARKTNASAAAQYIIDHFHPDKMIVMGTCAGIDTGFKIRDIVIPYRAVQVDTTVKELDRLIREDYIVEMDLSAYQFPFETGVIGSGDKAVVVWKDYLELRQNGISIADTESASIAYVCRMNGTECVIVRGISDFPQDVSFEDASRPDSRQIRNYLCNVPPVIEKILSQYLEKMIIAGISPQCPELTETPARRYHKTVDHIG